MFLMQRFALIFYRASTYPKLVKLLCVVMYTLGLLVFFGLFSKMPADTIPSSVEQHEAGHAPAATPPPPAPAEKPAAATQSTPPPAEKHEAPVRVAERKPDSPQSLVGQKVH